MFGIIIAIFVLSLIPFRLFQRAKFAMLRKSGHYLNTSFIAEVSKSRAVHCKSTHKNTSEFYKSQFNEDLILLDYFEGLCSGYYLEMGALDGVYLSNTYLFHKQFNWSGVLIEASPRSFARLQRNRPLDITYNHAVCSRKENVHFLDAELSPVSGIWEFMSPEFKSLWHSNITEDQLLIIPCTPLADILHSAGIAFFDYFSLDVEGAEYEVLQTIDFRAVGFGIIFIESNIKTKTLQKESIRILLESKGYVWRGRNAGSDWFINTRFNEYYRDLLTIN